MSRLLDAAKDYTRQAQSGIYTSASPSMQGATPAQVTQAFPRGGLDHQDARDELMKEKMEFLKSGGGMGMTPFGQIQATDADFQWLQHKRDQEALANLDAWVGQNFHTGDVTTRKWLQEIHPEYYEVREKEIMDRAKFALRVKFLLLRGPKNEKDLILLWGLQTGQIELDRDWDKIGPSQTDTQFKIAQEQKRFKKGLFSPLRYKTDGERGLNQNTAYGNPFKPVNDSAAGGQGALGGGRPFMGGTVPVAPGTGGRYPSFLRGLGI